jgi:hypothetical protein
MTSEHDSLFIARTMAEATAALVTGDDIAGILVQLLDECVRVVDAQAAGVMVLLADGTVEVLSASSHQAEQLELYQSQVQVGPCVECIETGVAVSASSAAEIERRWPPFAAAMLGAGFTAVQAQPMCWQGQLIGGLNLFRRAAEPLAEHQLLLGQAFADIATITVVHAGYVSGHDALARTKAALSSRNVIEQAKGVLAYRSGMDMAAAYEELKRLTAQSELTLTQIANQILWQVRQR